MLDPKEERGVNNNLSENGNQTGKEKTESKEKNQSSEDYFCSSEHPFDKLGISRT